MNREQRWRAVQNWVVLNIGSAKADVLLGIIAEIEGSGIDEERDACAGLADQYARRAFDAEYGSDEAGVAATHIADAIRARKQRA